MNKLIPFNEDTNTLPAHLREAFGDISNNDLAGGVSSGYPVLSFKGKTWSLREGGVSSIIEDVDKNGDAIPASSIEVVIVKANGHLSKVYYEGGYTEGSDEKPACYSNNGNSPEADAVNPQSTTCALCPHNQWGSRISENGSKGKACSDSRRMAVVPNGELGRPMLIRVPAASLKDLGAYSQLLTRRNAPYQAVATRIGFDPTVAHPKLTFKALRWLDAAEAAEVRTTMQSDVVAQIIGADHASVAALPPRPAHVEPEAPKPKAAMPKPAAKVAPKPEPAPEPEPVAAKKTTFGAPKAVAPKPAPEQSRAAQKIAAATDDLDAALAELDDL